jgi:hypothetical protein
MTREGRWDQQRAARHVLHGSAIVGSLEFELARASILDKIFIYGLGTKGELTSGKLTRQWSTKTYRSDGAIPSGFGSDSEVVRWSAVIEV